MSFIARRWSVMLAVLVALCILVVAPDVLMRLVVSPYIYGADAVPRTEVAIVLGASVVNGVPSPILQARADEALALYESGKVSKLLVSGDNGSVHYDEVTPVKEYLLEENVPPQDIFLDHAGFDTYSSMYRAAHIFGATSATVVTQDFHMPRALYLARAEGIDAVGVEAPGGDGDWFYYLREIPAAWKALFDVELGRVPKYLGATYSLSGDGEATW